MQARIRPIVSGKLALAVRIESFFFYLKSYSMLVVLAIISKEEWKKKEMCLLLEDSYVG